MYYGQPQASIYIGEKGAAPKETRSHVYGNPKTPIYIGEGEGCAPI